jgi:transcriptional regulator with GAF, ATPase, and Fis domain
VLFRSIPQELLESELFGHEKGAFTGAYQKRVGLFELAQRGSIFLDEIGEMPLATQSKLLRTLQEQEISPLGGKAAVKVDVRVIAASNADLEAWTREGQFRADLFYRLNVFPIKIPPLRERKEDIPELVDFFLKKYGRLKEGERRLSPEVLRSLAGYPWPGNVRELENVIERLTILSPGGEITSALLGLEVLRPSTPEQPIQPLRQAVRDFKRDLVERALSQAAGKKAQAARLLGLPSSNFIRLLGQLGLR